MTSIRSQSLILLFMSLFSFNSFIHAADINAGKDKATLCLGCHGPNGNSKNPMYPSLASQRTAYIESQLKAFQSGLRVNSIMQSVAANLTKQDIKNISAYFSSLKLEGAGADKTKAKKGQQKFSMCAGCHGADAQGLGSNPKLAGQQPKYLKNQLLNFKNGSRKGGPMQSITASLTEQDISDIADYLGSL